MKKSVLIMSIVMIWVIFLLWEIELSKWLDTKDQPMMRMDRLIILPGLILLTFYTLREAFKKNKQ